MIFSFTLAVNCHLLTLNISGFSFTVSILDLFLVLDWAEKGREKNDHFVPECLVRKDTLEIQQEGRCSKEKLCLCGIFIWSGFLVALNCRSST